MSLPNTHVLTAKLAGPLLAGLFLAGGCTRPPMPEAGGAPGRAAADVAAGKAVFDRICMACHTIGQGDRLGPDLQGVHQRRDEAWLRAWVSDPIGMSGSDPTGRELLAKWNGVPMPNPGLDESQVEQVLAYIADVSAAGGQAAVEELPVEMEPAEFERAKGLYFNRCAGCHGTLRKGATGPKITPEVTRARGTSTLRATITHGTPRGMPAWGDSGILDPEEVDLLVRFLQNPPPEPPQLTMDQVRASWKLLVPPEQRPAEPETDRDWQDFFGVVLRDVGQVAVIDGHTHQELAIIDTGFAVHILRSSSSGRYFYAVGRDGKVSMIDLWPRTPTLVAQVQGCYDARSVDASKYRGFEDRYVVEGCYWPPQYVVMDGATLEPLAVHGVLGATYDTGESLEEVRVASIVASHDDPLWVLSLKESGHIGLVDYSKPGFPMVARIPAERFLHDGGWDHTGRYFMVAANMRNKMVVVDVRERRLVTTFEVGTKPHPGRGANWQDPEYGWVNGTVHIGEGRLVVYGADPEGHPEYAWKVVREVEIPGTGSLFLKTHPGSPWVWLDTPLDNDPEGARQVCVYSKERGEIDRCWTPVDHGRVVHFEYNAAGDQVWVSGWDKKGTLVIYDDRTLQEVDRITGDWLVTPTGKFNVHNTAEDIY